MKTRVLMGGSAIFLGILGVAALFAPDEILKAAAVPASPLLFNSAPLSSSDSP